MFVVVAAENTVAASVRPSSLRAVSAFTAVAPNRPQGDMRGAPLSQTLSIDVWAH